jgi:hypothetical protein
MHTPPDEKMASLPFFHLGVFTTEKLQHTFDTAASMPPKAKQ